MEAYIPNGELYLFFIFELHSLWKIWNISHIPLQKSQRVRKICKLETIVLLSLSDGLDLVLLFSHGLQIIRSLDHLNLDIICEQYFGVIGFSFEGLSFTNFWQLPSLKMLLYCYSQKNFRLQFIFWPYRKCLIQFEQLKK